MATACQNVAAPLAIDTKRAAPRLGALDLARLAAAYGVIWIHTPRTEQLLHSRVLGRFAVPFFVAAAVLFVCDSVRRYPHRTYLKFAYARVVRLYVPFLAWTVIYLLFKAAKAAAAPELTNELPGWEAFWAGGFYHLWFMPFILVISILAFGVARFAIGHASREAAAGMLSLLGAIVLAFMPPPAWVAGVGSWGKLEWNALPAALAGLALAASCGCHPGLVSQRPKSAIASMLVALGCMGWLWYSPRATEAATLAGVSVLIAALACPASLIPRACQALGGLAFGIYLSHLLFIKTAEAIAAKLHWPIDGQLDVAIFLVAVVASTALSYLLSRWRATRWLVA
jgi:surface polysaccharide O-acyltransferase-like enzyme